VAMHRFPLLWRAHRVHHSDPALDVTTTVRQHPAESLFRYLVIAAVALPLGASPAAFAIYRLASAINAMLEHANFRLPPWLDAALSWVTSWPNAHKVHHSRRVEETNSNYGNLFMLWDRVFSTFKPAAHAAQIPFGLEGLDAAEQQTTRGLLAMPFATLPPARETARPS
jgi:sterol desaturase/sphingolipid hydroxylase (fatty acid hydroxylase superfamily)